MNLDTLKARTDYHREWMKNNPTKANQYYEKRKEKQAVYYREWYAQNGRKRAENYIETIALWQKLNPEKRRVCSLTRYAIQIGKIKKPKNCSECGDERKLVAHHDDYDFPYRVRWLCYSCHKIFHNNIN